MSDVWVCTWNLDQGEGQVITGVIGVWADFDTAKVDVAKRASSGFAKRSDDHWITPTNADGEFWSLTRWELW